MNLEPYTTYKVYLRGPAEIDLDSEKVSFEVSYLTERDVHKERKAGIMRDEKDPKTGPGHIDDPESLKNKFNSGPQIPSQWKDGARWGTATIKPGTAIYVKYLSHDTVHIMGSDDPKCERVVGTTTLDNITFDAPKSKVEGFKPNAEVYDRAMAADDFKAAVKGGNQKGAQSVAPVVRITETFSLN